jgi:hypothetical protein
MSLGKNRLKWSPTSFVIITYYIIILCGKKYPKNLGYSCTLLKNAQRKQSPNMRKFVQSGRSATEQKTVARLSCHLYATKEPISVLWIKYYSRVAASLVHAETAIFDIKKFFFSFFQEWTLKRGLWHFFPLEIAVLEFRVEILYQPFLLGMKSCL